MKLETHAKIAIWVGIVALVISMTFFTLQGSQELKYQYGRMFVDYQEMYDKLASTGTADAFIAKNSYFYEEFDVHRDGSARLEVYSINNQTGNRLELSIRYDQDDDKIRERINCQYNHRYYEEAQFAMAQSMSGSSPVAPEPFMPYLDGHARDQFVKDFIENTDCMDTPDMKIEIKRGLGEVIIEPEH